MPKFQVVRTSLIRRLLLVICCVLFRLLYMIWTERFEAEQKITDSVTNSVFGMAVGYRISDLSPFVLSLRHTGYRGNIVFGVGYPISEDLKLFAKKYKVILKGIDPYSIQNCTLCSLGLASRRYLFYLHWLEELGENTGNILITDVRDVIFQSDPFLEYSPQESTEIFVFEESFNFSIDTRRPFKTPWNRNWIIEAYGSGGLKKIGKETILCSGTTFAKHAGMKVYLMEMVHELNSFRRPCLKKKCCSCGESKGFDQGVHNFLIHTGKIKNASKKRYGESSVLTLGSLRFTDHVIVKDDDGYVLNALGKRASILHQYNRIPLNLTWLREIV